MCFRKNTIEDLPPIANCTEIKKTKLLIIKK